MINFVKSSPLKEVMLFYFKHLLINKFWSYLFILIVFGCALSCSDSEPNNLRQEKKEISFRIYEFEGQGLNYEQKNRAVVHVYKGDNLVYIDTALVKFRGGMSRAFGKKSISLNFSQPYELEGLPKRKRWVLNANYIDKTFIRHKMSYDIFQAMRQENIAPNSFFTTVYLNDFPQGLYLAMERIDDLKLQNDLQSAYPLVWKEPSVFMDNPYENIEKAQNIFHQKSPPLNEQDFGYQLDSLINFISKSSDAEFKKNIFKIVDQQSVIDWHLLLLLTNNGDGVVKNFFLYKTDSTGLFHFAPWDYDHSFGRDGDNELNLLDRGIAIERNVLFRRIIALNPEHYFQALYKRWKALSKSVFSRDYLSDYLARHQKENAEKIAENEQTWPYNDTTWYYDTNDFSQEMDIIALYLGIRLPQLERALRELSSSNNYSIP